MRADSRGFTLLELIIVCVLIGIMLVISVPAMRNSLIDDPLKAASRRVIGLVSEVRELAVRKQQAYFLYFDRGENRISYERDLGTEAGGKAAGQEDTTEESSVIFPQEVRISEIWTRTEGIYSDDQNRIWVNKKGYMDQTILHLTDGDNVLSLHFSPFLDDVKVYDKYTPVD